MDESDDKERRGGDKPLIAGAWRMPAVVHGLGSSLLAQARDSSAADSWTRAMIDAPESRSPPCCLSLEDLAAVRATLPPEASAVCDLCLGFALEEWLAQFGDASDRKRRRDERGRLYRETKRRTLNCAIKGLRQAEDALANSPAMDDLLFEFPREFLAEAARDEPERPSFLSEAGRTQELVRKEFFRYIKTIVKAANNAKKKLELHGETKEVEKHSAVSALGILYISSGGKMPGRGGNVREKPRGLWADFVEVVTTRAGLKWGTLHSHKAAVARNMKQTRQNKTKKRSETKSFDGTPRIIEDNRRLPPSPNEGA